MVLAVALVAPKRVRFGPVVLPSRLARGRFETLSEYDTRELYKLLKLPEERAGTVMAFRVFDRLSYALVMDAERPMHTADTVTNP